MRDTCKFCYVIRLFNTTQRTNTCYKNVLKTRFRGTCSKFNAHTEPLLKTLNLLKIEDIMKTKALKLYYRYKQNELPKYFEPMFTESNENHSHDTKHKSLLYQLPTKTSTGWLCIRHYIPELLSKTPECITEKLDTHSFSGFSNYMKNYYIRNYNENCLIEKCYICQK